MKTKRWIAVLLCFLLIGSLFPVNAFAAGGVIGGKYTLTLDENWEGGMGQVIPNITSYELPSATRPGEIFYGWALSPDGTVRYLAGDTVTLTDNLTLYAVWTFTQTFSITVQDGDGGSAFCDRSFAAAGETVTLTAMPIEDYIFVGWYVIAPNGLTIRDNKFIMPDSDVTVKARFSRGMVGYSYKVFICPGEGSGTVFAITNETTLLWQQYQAGTYDETKGTFFKNESGELFYEFPKQCPFTAPEGKVFDCWQASTTKDNLGSYSGGYIIGESVFPQDYTGGNTISLTALWKDAEQSAAYSITVESSNGGTATADNVSAAEGKTITLTATPNNGYHFKEWQSTDVTVTDNKFTMPEKDVTVKAVFEADTYTVTVQTDGNGTATADKAAYEKGETVTLTATPNNGYHFKEWQSTDVTVTDNKFTMPEKDVTVKAIFEADAPTTYTGTGWYLDADGVLHITGDISESGFNLTSEQRLQVKSVVAESGASISSGYSLFYEFQNMVSADLSELDTSRVGSMTYMFYDCSSLTSLDLCSINTSSVNDMSSMFARCSSLTSLDVSGFITDSLMSADNMFLDCSSLTSLGIRPDILYINAEDIIAICSSWQKQGSTDTYSTADELMAVTDTVTLLAMYTVNVQNDGNGTASANPAAAVKGETVTVTLTATPDTGYHFKEWQSSDVTVSGNTFTMPEKDVAVMAIFEADAPAAYTVSFNMNGHGNQVTAQTVREGNKATRPADPTAEGWTFAGWYADDSLSKAFDFTAVISADTTVYAKWTDSLTINYEGDNIILSDGKGGLAPQNAAPGENIEFSAKAISGYKVKSVTVTTDGGKSVDVTDQGSGVYSFVMPDDNVTVKAEAESDGDDGQITKITPGTTSLTLKPGKTETIKYTVEPAGATETVTFESSDPGVVTVDDKGVVTAVGLGTATITIKSASGKAMAKVTVTVDPFLYRMIRGDGQIVMQDAASAIFSSEANYGKFVAVEVDGKELGSGDFDSYSGSTIIELKAAFIRKLSLGIHTIRIISKDGYAMCKFTIKKLPETGDSSMTLLWTGCLVLALGGIVMLTRKRKVAR